MVVLFLRIYTLSDLSEKNIAAKKFRACLEFHIGRCKAPCEDRQSQEEYDANIKQIREIIKGDIGFAIRDLKKQMGSLAENLEFEKAADLRDEIELLRREVA